MRKKIVGLVLVGTVALFAACQSNGKTDDQDMEQNDSMKNDVLQKANDMLMPADTANTDSLSTDTLK